MISISLCMIVKNEEKVLPRCLDTVADLVEELIIVDSLRQAYNSGCLPPLLYDPFPDGSFFWFSGFSKALPARRSGWTAYTAYTALPVCLK